MSAKICVTKIFAQIVKKHDLSGLSQRKFVILHP